MCMTSALIKGDALSAPSYVYNVFKFMYVSHWIKHTIWRLPVNELKSETDKIWPQIYRKILACLDNAVKFGTHWAGILMNYDMKTD